MTIFLCYHAFIVSGQHRQRNLLVPFRVNKSSYDKYNLGLVARRSPRKVEISFNHVYYPVNELRIRQGRYSEGHLSFRDLRYSRREIHFLFREIHFFTQGDTIFMQGDTIFTQGDTFFIQGDTLFHAGRHNIHAGRYNRHTTKYIFNSGRYIFLFRELYTCTERSNGAQTGRVNGVKRVITGSSRGGGTN